MQQNELMIDIQELRQELAEVLEEHNYLAFICDDDRYPIDLLVFPRHRQEIYFVLILPSLASVKYSGKNSSWLVEQVDLLVKVKKVDEDYFRRKLESACQRFEHQHVFSFFTAQKEFGGWVLMEGCHGKKFWRLDRQEEPNASCKKTSRPVKEVIRDYDRLKQKLCRELEDEGCFVVKCNDDPIALVAFWPESGRIDLTHIDVSFHTATTCEVDALRPYAEYSQKRLKRLIDIVAPTHEGSIYVSVIRWSNGVWEKTFFWVRDVKPATEHVCTRLFIPFSQDVSKQVIQGGATS